MNTTTEAAGVAGALAVLADALADADNGRVASVYGSTAGINERRLREQAALATLQARLLAADELREAGDELREAVLESRDALQAFANDGMPPQYIRHMAAEERLAKALAAYDKAALALRPSGDGVG